MSTSAVEAMPRATSLRLTDDEIIVVLEDGRTLSTPLTWFPRLLAATREQRAQWRFIGHGEGIRWDGVDEDLSIAGLLRGEKALR